MNTKDLIFSVILSFTIFLFWIQGVLWFAVPLPILVYYYVLHTKMRALKLAPSPQNSHADQSEKVFIKIITPAFFLFCIIPVFFPYLFIAFDIGGSNQFLNDVRLAAAYHYDDVYHEMPGSLLISTHLGYFQLPEVLGELRYYKGDLPENFKIHFFTVYLFAVFTALGAFLTGTCLLLNKQWRDIPASFHVNISSQPTLKVLWMFIVFMMGFFFIMYFAVVPSRFDITSLTTRLFVLNLYGFIAPVIHAAVLSARLRKAKPI